MVSTPEAGVEEQSSAADHEGNREHDDEACWHLSIFRPWLIVGRLFVAWEGRPGTPTTEAEAHERRGVGQGSPRVTLRPSPPGL